MNERGFRNYGEAKISGMSATTIANYLKSETKPDSTKLEALRLLLGVNRNWLLNGVGEKERAGVISSEGQFATREDDG